MEKFVQNKLTIGLLKTYRMLRDSGKITVPDKALCAELDVDPTGFSQVKQGLRNAPDSLIKPFLKKFHLTESSLILAADTNTNTKKIQVAEPSVEYRPSKPVPYFELDVSAGNIEMFSDTPELPALSITIPGFDDCDMALPIYGDSMYPTFASGMIVMCKRIRDKSIIQYGETYLVITSEQRMVKRLQKGDRRESVLAVSDNESVNAEGLRKYESFEIPRDKIKHLYIVKGSIRRSQI